MTTRCTSIVVRRARWQIRVGLVATALVCLLAALSQPASALKPISVDPKLERLDITPLGVAFEGRSDTMQVETAPGADGVTGRIGVRANTQGTNPRWFAFALTNTTERTVELWLTADRYEAVGSGIIWPDLDSRRMEQVTNSTGFAPERVPSERTDIFRLTIERGQTVTYVTEIASERLPRMQLWKPVEYEQKQREKQLFNGIMLGFTGLLAIFLTAVFAANHKSIFPSAALVAWCVLALLCVDFGFWHKLFQMKPEDNAQYRAASEAAVAASLVMFLFSFLRVNLWHGFMRMLFLVWIAAQLSIVAVAVLDPRLAATVARMSMPLIGAIGAFTVAVLGLRNLDRALALVPTWILFIVWLFGAGVVLSGKLGGEAALFGIVSGLVLITLLIGFTVTQFAFRSNEPMYGTSAGEKQLRLAAIEQAGVAVFEWVARRDEVRLDPQVEAALGLGPGELPTKLKDFMSLLHPGDRERFRITLDGIKERGGGPMNLDLRLRHADSTYRSFELEGASVPAGDRRSLRCVGLVRDVTDAKRAQDRLLHDAVHDNLTGLPNRELFIDRLRSALARGRTDPTVQPAVVFFDIDKFKSVNSSFGLIVGDSILITVARKLSRILHPDDTIGRIGGDQFALLLLARRDPRDLAAFAEAVRQTLRSPVRIAGQEIVLTGSIGVAIADGQQADARDLLREAEIAMHWARKAGTDRIELFRAEMRAEKDDRIAIESDLRRAIDNRELTLLYQPIVALSSEELIGFEALVRWQHPRLGLLSPADFVPIAEETDLIVQLGSFVLNRALADIARLQKEFPRPEQPLFVSVNVSSRQLIKPDLVQEIRQAIGRAVVPKGTLRLEITETLVMDNPEQATHILELLRDAGVQLALDDFGTGYSSLAYLNRFPFDTIKIDRALVQSSSDNETSAAIVRSIVALAHELGKRIVAEGVETAEDAAFLRSIGAQYAQGFYYGEPMGEQDVSRLVRLIRKSDRRMRRRGLVRVQEKRKGQDAAPQNGPTPTAITNGAGAPQPSSQPSANPGQLPPSRSPAQPITGAPSQPFTPSSPAGMPPRTSIPSQPPEPPSQRPASAPANGPFPPAVPNTHSGLPPDSIAARILQPRTGAPRTGPPLGDAMSMASKGQPPLSQVPPQPQTASRPLPPAAPPLPHMGSMPSLPASAPPLPHQADPRPAPANFGDATSPASRSFGQRVRPPRKANLAALSPAVAASLEKLAGGTARARAEQPAPTTGTERPGDIGEPKRRSDAAE